MSERTKKQQEPEVKQQEPEVKQQEPEVKQQEPEVKQQESGAGQTAKVTQKKTVIYIGPSIKNVVSTGTLYNNGLPKILKEEMAKQPVIKKLIIPVEDLSEAQRKLTTPGSALATVYGKVITQEDGR